MIMMVMMTGHLYGIFSWQLTFKAHRMARVNEGSHNFTCHPHVYRRMEWAILSLLPVAEHHRTLTGTHFPSTECRRLSWPVWLVIPRWYARSKTVTHPSTSRPIARRCWWCHITWPLVSAFNALDDPACCCCWLSMGQGHHSALF